VVAGHQTHFAASVDCATISSMKTRLFTLLWIALVSSLVLASLWLVSGPAQAQNPAGELLRLINAARLNQGLHPYVVGRELATAAQRHSADMAATGQISHSGSDGTSSTQRIMEAGYAAYEFGLVASENIYGGVGEADVPFNTWMGQPDARSNLLHEQYREVGIGVVSDAQGRLFWTLNVGARPNVLPVLINDGAASVDTLTVTLRLVPENVVPEGRGTAMGQPVEYRASTSSQFPSSEWNPWAEQVAFVLDEAPGQQTVYVQLRDAVGRTTVSQASVTLTGLGATAPSVTLTTTPSGEPETPPTATGTVTPTPPTSPTSTGTTTPTPTGTPRPTPTASATPRPTITVTPLPTPTPFPTQTPTSVPSATLPAEPQVEAATATSPPPATPPAPATIAPPEPTRPIPGGMDDGGEAEPPSLASRLAPWAVGLQGIALILGVYLALRRPGTEADGEERV
jgi:uncharacterized protein YkwD